MINKFGFSRPLDVIIIVVFVSVLFIAGMYVWNQYILSTSGNNSIPQSVLDERNRWINDYGTTASISYCQKEDEAMYALQFINLSSRASFYDTNGNLIKAWSGGDVIDRFSEPFPFDLKQYNCEVLLAGE